MERETDLIHANFFFVDGIGLSDPMMSTKTQLKKIEALHNCVRNCKTYFETPSEQVLKIPTGDGMCLGFLQGIDRPIRLAMEMQEKLEKYNKGKIPSEIIQVRIGIHSGNCFTFTDIDGNQNVWGPGIIIAKRIMDLGETGHILLSRRITEDLFELSDEYSSFIKPIGDYELKHNISLLVYSAYGEDFGNPYTPQSGLVQHSRLKEENSRLQNTTMYQHVIARLDVIDDDSMLIHHKRTYQIKNLTDDPIKYVLHGIATDVEKKSINDLNLRTFDDSGKQMRISSINLDKPFCKEFSTEFETPITKDDSNRRYTLEYDVEEPERFFENAFQVNCKRFDLEFSFKNNSKIMPVLFEVNQETEQKRESQARKNIAEYDGHVKITWTFEDMVKGRAIRLEW